MGAPLKIIPLFLLCTKLLNAETLVFNSAVQWQTWTSPHGLTQIGPEGQLQLVNFRKNTDVVADAHTFTHLSRTRGDAVAGGIWEAGSNPATAGRVIDGDPETFWRPDPTSPLGRWFVQIDLGRTVLAKEIRLTFPDQPGARPFKQFTVFVSTGITSDPLDDLFIFEPVFRTTLPNQKATLAIPLSFTNQDSARVLDADLEIDPQEKNQYRLIQFINFTVEEDFPEGALAEIEVTGVGDNLSIGTLERGFILDGLTARANVGLFDADMNTQNSILPVAFDTETWQSQATWFYVDLGATFWIDDLFFYVLRNQEGGIGNFGGAPRGFALLTSDGSRTIGTQLPVPEPIDFTTLLTQEDPSAVPLRYLRYLFKPRQVRYLFWHALSPRGWSSRWAELMMFSPGYPAKVELRSAFLDLGQLAGDNRPKVVTNLSWDADLPPGTRLQLRTRSGNFIEEVYTFFDRSNSEVSEARWNSAPRVLRGPVDTTLVVGEDWDAWSNNYQFPNEAFKSQSPRRFVQVEMILSTDDPQVAPTVNQLTLEFEDALLNAARGSIAPRQAEANALTRFTYTLWPSVGDEDLGFDTMRFILPGAVDLSSLEIQVGASTVLPAQVALEGDSLLVLLPEPVRTDSVQTSFSTRVLHNATLFSLELGNSQRPGVWQSAEAAQRRSNIVMLPDLPSSNGLIDDLEIAPATFTPNGDGINDQTRIRFVPLKVTATEPKVQIFDMNGNLQATLDRKIEGMYWNYSWDGQANGGALVAPGIYLCRIDLGAKAGNDSRLHTLRVAY